MPSESFEFQHVTRLTAGAVGSPGKRTFYLQIEVSGQVISLVLEKEQLRALAERLQELLAEEGLAGEPRPDMSLREPLLAAWRVGTVRLAYDEEDKRFEVSLLELVDEGQTAATGRFLASQEQMRALGRHALEVVAAGRPPCPFCGGPIDHDGRVCPRANGHVA